MGAFKISKRIKNYMITAALVLIIPLAQVGFETTNSIRNKKLYKSSAYSSEAELQSEFKIEKKKLGLENLTVNLEVVNDLNEPEIIRSCLFYNKNKFDILIGKNYMTRGVLRHQLYHAYRMHGGYITRKRERWNPFHTLEDWKTTSYALKEE